MLRIRFVTLLLSIGGLAACGAPAPTLSPIAARGAEAFAQNCAMCHVADQPTHAAGPTLHGVVGRIAGTTNFPMYSRAMKTAGFAWTTDQLDRFLAAPRETVPGNQMAFYGMEDPATRSAIVAYLAAQSPQR